MSSWVGGIAAVTLFVEDLEATKAYYARVFDLPVHYEDDASAVFEFGGTLINLLRATAAVDLIAPAVPGGWDAGPRVQFTIGVTDVDEMAGLLVSRGAELLNGPMDRP